VPTPYNFRSCVYNYVKQSPKKVEDRNKEEKILWKLGYSLQNDAIFCINGQTYEVKNAPKYKLD
jgi:hypothetical protein